MEWVESRDHLEELLERHEDFLVLFFYGGFSEAAQRARDELRQFIADNPDIPLYGLDVTRVKGVHRQYDVENVPTVIALENGEATRSVEGVQSARFYEVAFAGGPSTRPGGEGSKQRHRVVVYSGPGCPACGQAKTYLRRHRISFREVDIARDQRAARRLKRRSGRMAVPQIDVDGELVVGFNQSKLDRLLGIEQEGSQK